MIAFTGTFGAYFFVAAYTFCKGISDFNHKRSLMPRSGRHFSKNAVSSAVTGVTDGLAGAALALALWVISSRAFGATEPFSAEVTDPFSFDGEILPLAAAVDSRSDLGLRPGCPLWDE
jgi:hypothetical protein